MNRRTFLKITSTGATAPLWMPSARSAEPRQRTGDELLAEARARIPQHRTGKGVVVIRNAQGQPVSGAHVKIEQVRHEFLFGCNLFRHGRIKDPDKEAAYREHYRALLNYATLGFYWAAYEPARGNPSYGYTDQVLDWCRGQNITCKGHPLAWDHPASSPRWLPSDLAEVQRLSTTRVKEIIERFKGRIDLWDVVNEPTDLKRFKNRMNDWAQGMGAVPYTRLHLEVARAASPTATLLVNDYRTDQEFYKILDALRKGGKLLYDTVGIQSHMHDGGWRLPQIWEVCDRFARLGLPVHFTETTIVSGPRRGPGENWGPTTPELEEKQADYVPRFYTMLFAHPSVQAITWWDFSDDGAWQGAAAGWLRKDMSPKPVYDRLMKLIKGEWWTRENGRTNAEGQWSTRAFYGRHRVTVELNGKSLSREVDWRRDQANQVELTLNT